MTRLARVGLALGCAALASMAGAAPAAAQLAEGARSLAEADFERAERAFDRALEARELSRADVVSICEGRAMARWALGEESGARADLAALASLEPGHVLPPEAPPPLVEAFAASAHEPLALVPRWEDGTPGTTRLGITVLHDAGGLVELVRVHARRRGEPWSVYDEPSVEVAHRDGEVVEAWVEAIGPGGAVLVREGSELAPLEHGGSLPEGVRAALASPETPSDATWLWVGVGVGAAVLVAVVLGVGIGVGTAQSDVTQPSAPVVIGF